MGKTCEANPAPIHDGLAIVVDANNRPLCHMPLQSAKNQNLFHRSVALMLIHDANSFVLRWKSALEIDFPVYGPLPASHRPMDYCRECLASRWGLPEIPLKKINTWNPCPENDQTFTLIYQGKLTNIPKNPDNELFVATKKELAGLRRAGCLLNPLLSLVL